MNSIPVINNRCDSDENNLYVSCGYNKFSCSKSYGFPSKKEACAYASRTPCGYYSGNIGDCGHLTPPDPRTPLYQYSISFVPILLIIVIIMVLITFIFQMVRK